MPKQRKTYSADLKARIALEAIKGQRTINEIAGHYGVHPHQVMPWKKPALAELPHVFSERRTRMSQDEDTLKAQLYQQIGQLAEGRTRLAQKKSWTPQLKPNASG
jgi:putative transposase